MTDTRPGVTVPPPVTAAQRSVLYAVRRRGEATVLDVATSLDWPPDPPPDEPWRAWHIGGLLLPQAAGTDGMFLARWHRPN